MKRACTPKQIEQRRQEIIQSVNVMFDTMDYQDISMKSISERISIARSSLYCYYESKEEIMLDIMKNDYIDFMNQLIKVFNSPTDDVELLASNVASVYLSHIRLLRIISVYLTDIEDHVSLEKLIAFKRDFVPLMKELLVSIKKALPQLNEKEDEEIFNSLLMLTHGLYPMISPHEKQVKAMKEVGMKVNEDPFAYAKNYLVFIFSKK